MSMPLLQERGCGLRIRGEDYGAERDGSAVHAGTATRPQVRQGHSDRACIIWISLEMVDGLTPNRRAIACGGCQNRSLRRYSNLEQLGGSLKEEQNRSTTCMRRTKNNATFLSPTPRTRPARPGRR